MCDDSPRTLHLTAHRAGLLLDLVTEEAAINQARSAHQERRAGAVSEANQLEGANLQALRTELFPLVPVAYQQAVGEDPTRRYRLWLHQQTEEAGE